MREVPRALRIGYHPRRTPCSSHDGAGSSPDE